MARELTFQLNYPVRQAGELEHVAEKMSVLKKHGRVEVIVGNLAEGTVSDVPPGGSSWHDYTTYLTTWQKLFPHEKMKPFVDMEHVGRNRALLKDIMKIVRKHGYAAGVQFHTPFYMPEAFFEKYPQMRGPRCDHPRRSRREAFSLCVDHPETLAMIKEMSAEMAREIPEIEWLKIKTNDAGAGLCWSDWIYIGPNGPSACKHISTAQRVKKMLDTIVEGAGKDLDFVMNGNFSEAELREMALSIGESFHYELHHGAHEDDRQVNIGGQGDNPIKGIVNVAGVLEHLALTKNPIAGRVGLNFLMNYHRGHDNEEVADLVIDLVDMFFSEPAYGTVERFNLLRKICEKWVGAKKRDDLLEALVDLHEAYKKKNLMTFPPLSNYMGVSMRHINRPCVILPELLTADEESYFLPHIFNIHTNEARVDYWDGHGSKLSGGGPMWFDEVNPDPRLDVLDDFREETHEIASVLDTMGGTPAGETFQRMAVALRLYGCVMRSVNNCRSMGIVRDRNTGKLSGPPHIPPKLGDWIGDPDLQLMNSYMRDELDNTAEMISLLENGGSRQVLTATRPQDEDTFLLGPDLLGQLRKKSQIMRRHWLDAQAYMSTPHK